MAPSGLANPHSGQWTAIGGASGPQAAESSSDCWALPARISVFPIMGGIFLALLAPGWVATALLIWGLVMAIIATVLYAQTGIRSVRARQAAS